MSLAPAPPPPPDSGGVRPRTATVLLGVAAYLTARTFVVPGVPVLLRGDQAFAWMYAERLLRGQHVYKDFFQFTPPGADVVYAVAFALFGPRMALVNAVVVLLGVLLASAAFRIARSFMPSGAAALAIALYTVLVFGQPLDATHHYWSVLFVMASVAALGAASTPRRLFAAGALVGVASFFTQTHGAMAFVALVAFTLWEARTEQLPRGSLLTRLGSLALGAAVSLTLLWTYFVVTSGLGAIASCTVAYPWRHMRAPLSLDLALPEALTTTSIRWLLPYLIVYVIAVGAYPLAWLRRARIGGPERRCVTLLSFVGVMLLVGIVPSPSWVRIFAVSMPAFLLLGEALAGNRILRATSWVSVVLLACVLVRSTYVHHDVTVALPAGTVRTAAANREKLLWLTERVPPGTVLFAADRSALYTQLDVTSPLYLDAIVTGDQLSHEQATRLLADWAASRLPIVLWSANLGPDLPEERGPDMDALRDYLHAHYTLTRIFADGDEVWDLR